MIKKLYAASAIMLALSSSASTFAADLPSQKAPPPAYFPPPPPLWTGFYLGANAGGTWNNHNSVDTVSWPIFPNGVVGGRRTTALAALASGSTPVGDKGAFIGGGQIGYNWQFKDSFVAGVEADIQGVANSGGAEATTTVGIVRPVITTLSSTKTLDYLGTVRGRLGWLFTPTLLAYGTGGLAYGGVSANTSILQLGLVRGFVGFGGDSFSDTRVGWTAGGGVEWMFLPNWSAKAEYLYYDLGDVSSSGALISGGASPAALYAAPQSTARFDGHIVRAGLNYHFNLFAPAPVIAKH